MELKQSGKRKRTEQKFDTKKKKKLESKLNNCSECELRGYDIKKAERCPLCWVANRNVYNCKHLNKRCFTLKEVIDIQKNVSNNEFDGKKGDYEIDVFFYQI